MKQTLALLIILFLVPLTASAQDFCEGNFDYDDNQDGSDAFLFKTDFGRSILGNPCPPDGPVPVAKTGQSWCSDESGVAIICAGTGQDGDLQKGVEWPNPRFTDNGDGTVTDNLTGLIWLRDANCSLFNAPRTWEYALNIIVPQLEDGFCDLTDGSNVGDWRLPNRFELESLLDLGTSLPALQGGHPFTNVRNDYYWTSTVRISLPSSAWSVYMANGGVFSYDKTLTYYVWPVRGGR